MTHPPSKHPMGHKRKQFWVDAPFQLQILGYVLLLVTASLLLVSLSVHRGLHEASAESHQMFHSLEWINQAIRPPLLLSSAISIMVSAMVTLLWSHRIAGPLRVISAAIHRISKGNLSTAVRVRETDSLKELVEEFSKMQTGLRETFEADRSRLEQLSRQAAEAAEDMSEKDPAREKVLRLASDLAAAAARERL